MKCCFISSHHVTIDLITTLQVWKERHMPKTVDQSPQVRQIKWPLPLRYLAKNKPQIHSANNAYSHGIALDPEDTNHAQFKHDLYATTIPNELQQALFPSPERRSFSWRPSRRPVISVNTKGLLWLVQSHSLETVLWVQTPSLQPLLTSKASYSTALVSQIPLSCLAPGTITLRSRNHLFAGFGLLS